MDRGFRLNADTIEVLMCGTTLSVPATFYEYTCVYTAEQSRAGAGTLASIFEAQCKMPDCAGIEFVFGQHKRKVKRYLGETNMG